MAIYDGQFYKTDVMEWRMVITEIKILPACTVVGLGHYCISKFSGT